MANPHLIALPTAAAARSDERVSPKIGTTRTRERARDFQSNRNGSRYLFARRLDEFEVNTQKGIFQCVVHPPLAISVKTPRKMCAAQPLRIDFIKWILPQPP